jgi:hypothetical protein
MPLFHQMYKYFCYALEGKHLVNKVRLRISSDSVMLLIIKDGWRLESWLVIGCIVLNKDLLIKPNRFSKQKIFLMIFKILIKLSLLVCWFCNN